MSEPVYELMMNGQWRCYSPSLNWIAFSGYGDTKELAEIDLHKNLSSAFKSVRRPDCSINHTPA